MVLQIECGGNGRSTFNPPAKGNQWTVGAVACSEWTGVRYADVLKAAGVKDGAVYTGHYGADTHLSGDPEKLPISRGVPISKAMDPELPDRVRDEWCATSSDERRAATHRLSRLAGIVLAKVAQSHLGSRPNS